MMEDNIFKVLDKSVHESLLLDLVIIPIMMVFYKLCALQSPCYQLV